MARRSFLRGCGGSAALLLPLLRNIEARAQGLAAPRRFLVLHHPLGTQIDRWRPAGVTATTNTFTLAANNAAFAPLQSKMLMIDGVNIVSASRVSGSSGDKTHEGGLVALMTGQQTLGKIGQEDHAAGGASIDQIFLQRSPLLGGAASTAKTPFGSLQLAADIRSDRDEVAPRVMSYLDATAGQTDISKARQPLYPETQPLNVFNRLFGGSMSGTSTDAARLLLQKRSMLDFMRRDLARLRAMVPASELVKCDAQAAAIQELEQTIRMALETSTMACAKPTAPPNFTETGVAAGGSRLSGLDYYIPSDANNHPHQTLGQLQLALIRAAFTCDLARVATFMWSAGTNWVVFPGTFQGASIAGNKQASAHHPFSHVTDTGTLAWLSQIESFYAVQSAMALNLFNTAVDFDGAMLLDNTVVAYVTEVARAWDHDQRNVPFLLFGGKNTKIQGGKYLKATGGNLPAIDAGAAATNRPTNDVWLGLAPAFGITNMTTLGAPAQYRSPLAGIIA